MLEWHEIAMPTGTPQEGHLSFYVDYRVPEAETEIPATENQIFSVGLFYNRDLGVLSDDQAHHLLCVREYARCCTSAIFPRYHERIKDVLGPVLAAYVLSREDITAFVVKWSEQNFERATSNPRVKGTQFFPEVRAFAEYIQGSLEMLGWTESVLRKWC